MSDSYEITLNTTSISDRMPYIPGGGGALNANYTLVDAVAIISSQCGKMGLVYGEDFYFKRGGGDHVTFTFKDEKNAFALGLMV